MEISIIAELVGFESSQKARLETRKNELRSALVKKKELLLAEFEKEIFLLMQQKHDAINNAISQAKKDAERTAQSFAQKTDEIRMKSSTRVDDAAAAVFREFLNV